MLIYEQKYKTCISSDIQLEIQGGKS